MHTDTLASPNLDIYVQIEYAIGGRDFPKRDIHGFRCVLSLFLSIP